MATMRKEKRKKLIALLISFQKYVFFDLLNWFPKMHETGPATPT